MLKWLEKIIAGSKTDAVETLPKPEAPPASTKPNEPALPAPRIYLDHAATEEAFSYGVLSRQVIVDRAYHPVAYEFGLRNDSAHDGIAAATILAGVLGRLGDTELVAGRQAWLRVKDIELSEAVTTALESSPAILVLELTDGDSGDTALEHARHLKAEGFQLALADWHDTARYHAWLPLCDFVEVRNTKHNPVELGSWPDKLSALSPGVAVVACDVDSWEELEFCHRQNFKFFRGNFLTHRENWPRQPKIPPERARLVGLLNRLHLGAELAEIADQLKQSPELSYRLLRYINSAAIGSTGRIASIQQGLMVLGRDKIYRWLTVLLFTSGQTKSLDSALLEQALVRARLMELLAGDRYDRLQVDEIFVVGIFSLLDMLLQLPMSVALEPLKLPDPVQQALLDNDSMESEYAPLLNLAIACEEGHRDRLKSLAIELAIPLAIINSAHLEALVWTQQTLAEK